MNLTGKQQQQNGLLHKDVEEDTLQTEKEHHDTLSDIIYDDNTANTTNSNIDMMIPRTCWDRFCIESSLYCKPSWLFSKYDPGSIGRGASNKERRNLTNHVITSSSDGGLKSEQEQESQDDNNIKYLIIDIPESFAPGSNNIVYIILWKLFATYFSLTTIIYGYINVSKPGFYMAYLTHWGVTFCTIYLLLSLYHIESKQNHSYHNRHWLLQYIYHERIEQPPVDSIYNTLLVRITWYFYIIGIHTTSVATLLFWPLVFDPSDQFKFTTFAAHGGLLIIMIIDGMYVNRIPLYISHWLYISLPIDILFVIWTLIHDFVQIGNPDHNDDQDMNDDALYVNVIMWNDDWQISLFWSFICVFVLGPAMFILLWLLSNGYIFNCCTNNKKKEHSSRLRYYQNSHDFNNSSQNNNHQSNSDDDHDDVHDPNDDNRKFLSQKQQQEQKIEKVDMSLDPV